MVKKSKIKNKKKWQIFDSVPITCPTCGGPVTKNITGGRKLLECSTCGTIGEVVQTISNKTIEFTVR